MIVYFFKNFPAQSVLTHFISLGIKEVTPRNKPTANVRTKTLVSGQKQDGNLSCSKPVFNDQNRYMSSATKPKLYKEMNTNLARCENRMTPEIQLEYKRKSKTNRTQLFRSGGKTDMSSKPPPDLDLFNLQFHESDDNNMEIISHRKTRKLISTDINTIITGSTTPVKGQPKRQTRSQARNNTG